jgi:hypothetical protein
LVWLVKLQVTRLMLNILNCRVVINCHEWIIMCMLEAQASSDNIIKQQFLGMQDFALMGTWSLTIIIDANFELFIFIIKFTLEAIFFKLNFYAMANYPYFFSIQGLYMFSMLSLGCLMCGLVFQVPWALSLLNC